MKFALQFSVSFELSHGNCSNICRCISQIYAKLYAQFSEIVGELCAHFSRIADKFCAQFSKILRKFHCNFSEILWKFHCNFSKLRLQIGMNFAAISQKTAGSGDNTTPMQIRKSNRVRICIGVLFILFSTADERCSPLHTDMYPPWLVCSYGCTHVRNFSETPIRFFCVYPQSHSHQTSHAHPKQYVKTQIFRAAGNPKGVRPFWSF